MEGTETLEEMKMIPTDYREKSGEKDGRWKEGEPVQRKREGREKQERTLSKW